MDGHSQNSDVHEPYWAVIEQWMLSNIEGKGLERYDDLHVNRINERWKDRASWIDGGLEALRVGIELRNRYRFDLTVALGFSLIAGEALTTARPESRRELLAQIDWSPPSLYLFSRRREPWIETGGRVTTLDKLGDEIPYPRDNELKLTQWYYIEFTQDDQPHRSAFLAG